MSPLKKQIKQIVLREEKMHIGAKTSQELRMLSNVALNCQVAKIVMISGSQLSEL